MFAEYLLSRDGTRVRLIVNIIAITVMSCLALFSYLFVYKASMTNDLRLLAIGLGLFGAGVPIMSKTPRKTVAL